MGQPCGIISAVGNDDFGRINLARPARDGVDISAITTDPDPGLPLPETLRRAAAAGALAVTKRGSMAGAATLAQLLAFAR